MTNDINNLNAQIHTEVTEMYCGSIGKTVFISWGYISVFFLLLEFLALKIWNDDWCYFLWIGIPVVGLLQGADSIFIHKNRKALDWQNTTVLYTWAFIGFTCGISGFMTGVTGLFAPCFLTFVGLLFSIGSFITGALLRLRSHIVCAFIGAALSFLTLLFQGDQWPWQLVTTAAVVTVSMIIPGHLFDSNEKNK
jgi:hypothetical protein